MTSDERDVLIERVITAHRPRDPFDALKPEPAFYDLDEAGRLEAYARTVQTRLLEAALDKAGLSSTGRAVLARITRS